MKCKRTTREEKKQKRNRARNKKEGIGKRYKGWGKEKERKEEKSG